MYQKEQSYKLAHTYEANGTVLMGFQAQPKGAQETGKGSDCISPRLPCYEGSRWPTRR